MPESAGCGGGRGALFPGKPLLAFGSRESGHLPEWRNWQTRKIQVLVQVTGWRFKSSLGHFRGFSSPGSIPRRPFWRAGVGPEASPAGERLRGAAGRERFSGAYRFDSPLRRPGPPASSSGRPSGNLLAGVPGPVCRGASRPAGGEVLPGRRAGSGEERRALSAAGVIRPLPHRKSRFADVAVIRQARESRPPCRRSQARLRRRLQELSGGAPRRGIPGEMTPRDAWSQEKSLSGVDISKGLPTKTC